MSANKIAYRKWLRRSSIFFMGFWAAGLLTFFSNPEGTREQLGKMMSWFGATKLAKQDERPCETFETVAWRMVDTVEQYWQNSYENGVGDPVKSDRSIEKSVKNGSLVALEETPFYMLDTLRYSLPLAVPKTKELLELVSERFQRELVNTNLAGTRLIVTSVLRTENSVKELMKHNRNAIKNTSHLHGTTFDVSYASYNFTRPIDHQEADYLREVLANVLFKLRKEKRCWVTYELYQPCFHVVLRTDNNG